VNKFLNSIQFRLNWQLSLLKSIHGFEHRDWSWRSCFNYPLRIIYSEIIRDVYRENHWGSLKLKRGLLK